MPCRSVYSQLNNEQFSASALSCLKRLLDGEKVNQENSGLGKREWDDFCRAIGRAS